jgi:ABC-type amino acid transport system permease subunit
MKNYKFLMVLKFTGIFIALALGLGFLIMALWNWLVPVLFLGPVINFWQAIGLLVLSKILFGGFKGRGGSCGGKYPRHEYWRKKMEERMAGMTDEEKEKYRNRCNWRNTQS